jgi:putative membrane protein
MPERVIENRGGVMNKILLIGFTISALTSSYSYAQMGQGMMGPGMMNWGGGMGWGGSIIMMAFWIAVIVGIIFLIRWVVLSTDRRHETKSEDSAMDILRNRYAGGEINKEEFEEKKKDLN